MEYYGREPSSDFFAHYGVRGMHWGVRKAKETRNFKKLNREYTKAIKKLNKLNALADIDIQRESAKKHNRRAGISLGVGLTGLAGATNLKMTAMKKAKELLNTPTVNVINEIAPKTYRKKKYLGEGKPIFKTGEGLDIGPVGTNARGSIPVNGGKAKTSPQVKQIKAVDKLYRGLLIGGLGSAAYQKGKALAAKYRTTPTGHAKAVAKRDLWEREMNDAFFGQNHRYGVNRNRRKKKNA